MDSRLKKIFLFSFFSILLCSCDFIDFTPKKETVGDFQFHFDEKQENVISDEELEKFVKTQASDFENWLGENPEKNVFKYKHPNKTKIDLFVEKDKPVAPGYNKEVCGWTYEQQESHIWEEKFLDEGCGAYELEHHFIVRIWLDQGRIDNPREYDEKESLDWRKKHGI